MQHTQTEKGKKEAVITDKKGREATYKIRAELTGYEVKASLLLRIVLHLAGEQVEFSRRPVSLPEREGGSATTT